MSLDIHKDSIPGAGNAIVFSPDERALYVTASDGKLVAIQPSGGRVLAEYEVPRNSKNWKVTCHSGITIGDEYLVYAVVDEPPEGDFETTLRLDTDRYRFVRAELWQGERGLAFSNCLYFVPASREVPSTHRLVDAR